MSLTITLVQQTSDVYDGHSAQVAQGKTELLWGGQHERPGYASLFVEQLTTGMS